MSDNRDIRDGEAPDHLGELMAEIQAHGVDAVALNFRRPIAHFGRRYHFSASHRLHCDDLSEARNREVFGKCNNPYGHGHNYVVEVILAGPIDAATGMVTNLADLDAFAARGLIARFDHQNLNLLPEFEAKVSTTENLAVEVWNLFRDYPQARLKVVRVEETGNNSFEYFGGAG